MLQNNSGGILEIIECRKKEINSKEEVLAQKMRDYADEHVCRKCSEDYCEHMLSARERKFKKEIECLLVSSLIVDNVKRRELDKFFD